MTRALQVRTEGPINLAAEILGDRWSVIVIRDVTFGGPRHFSDLHRNSLEGIMDELRTPCTSAQTHPTTANARSD